MAIEIHGDREVMSQMLFGPPPMHLQQYIQQTNQYFSNLLTDVGRKFVDTAQTVFARMDTSEAMEIAKAALRMANIHLQHDVIYGMSSVEQVQEAPNSMVRWIMCHPQLQQLHQENRIEAYGERFIAPYITIGVAWQNPDYCRVYEGWMNEVTETITLEDGTTQEETYVEWVDTLEEDDDVILSDIEALYVKQAHELVDQAIEAGIDPTSYYNSQIL